MKKMSEKELIIRDLYVMNNFYQEEPKYNSFLQQKDVPVDKAVVNVLGKDIVVSTKQDVIDAIVYNGNKFQDEFGKNEPQKFTATFDESKVPSPGFIVGLIVPGAILFAVTAFVAILLPFEVYPLNSILVPYIIDIIACLIGGALLVFGIFESTKRRRANVAFENAKRMERTTNKRIDEWNKKQEQILNRRRQDVYSLYEEEIKLCWQEYNLKIQTCNETKKKHLLEVDSILSSIKNVMNESIIPIFYLQQKDAVQKMLFFMLNKRADSIKELINLYETTVWQENVLKQLSISNRNLIIQNEMLLGGLLKIDESINNLVYSMEHLEFETLSFGVLI